jgi:quinol monooxygenase YgiN
VTYVAATSIAFIRARPQKSAELGRRLLALVEPTRQEVGCINYDVHRSSDDPDVWVMHENWRSAADLDAHFEMPYLKEFLAHSDQLLADLSVQAGSLGYLACSPCSAPFKSLSECTEIRSVNRHFFAQLARPVNRVDDFHELNSLT